MSRVTHMIHHADPSIDRNKKSTITHKSIKTSTPVSTALIANIAIELSRKADYVDVEAFKQNCLIVFDTLIDIQSKLDAIQSLEPSSPEA